MADEEKRPVLRVVRGEPDDVELAALTAVVASLRAVPAPTAEQPPPSRWADKSRLVRGSLPRGEGAWRASGLPR